MREGWIECKAEHLGDLVRGINYKKPQSADRDKTGYIPILRANNIDSNKLNFKNLKYVEQELVKSEQKILKGDIVIAMSSGSKHLVGKSGQAQTDVHASFGAFCSVFRPNKNIDPNFIQYYFHSSAFRRIISNESKGSNINNLKREHVLNALIPIPANTEQRAIVAKIEELFSDLDQGIADLKKAQAQLKVYRQAVLKKAFEGELTKEWREKQTNLPTADELLEQIKEERQQHYEQQLESWEKTVKAWEENDKVGKKPSKPQLYKEFNSPVRPLKLNIPAMWFFDCIGNVCSKTEYGSSLKSSLIGNVPVLRMGNMQNGKIDWTDLKFTSDDIEIEQYSLKNGDVLFNRTNSPELVGKTVQYKGERTAIFAGYLIRLNHIEKIMSGAYLNHFLNSHSAKVYGSFVKTDGVNQSNINGEKLSNYPFPCCSLMEQHQIVREIESRLSVCDQVEKSIEESLTKAEALRQSILKKAFEGSLLTQAEIEASKHQPDWEPASVLLERIKKEKIK